MRILVSALAVVLAAEVAFIGWLIAVPMRHGVVDIGTMAFIQLGAQTLLSVGVVCSSVSVILARIHPIARRQGAATLAGICGIVIGGFVILQIDWPPPTWERIEWILALAAFVVGALGIALCQIERRKTAEPSATDNPDDAQRLREDH